MLSRALPQDRTRLLKVSALDLVFLIGLSLLTFTFPIELVLSVGLAITCVGALFSFQSGIILKKLPIPALLGLLYLGVLVLSLVWAYNPAASAFRVGINAVGLLVFLHVLRSCSSGPDPAQAWRRWCGFLGVSGLICALHYMANVVSLGREQMLTEAVGERYVGGLLALTWGASNTIAAALILPFFAGLAMAGDGKRSRWVWGVSSGVVLLAIIATFSRTAVVSLLVSAILGIVLSHRKVRSLGFVALALAAVALFVVSLGSDVYTFLLETRLGGESKLDTLNGRIGLWEFYLQELTDRFPIPVGYYSCLHMFGVSPHNVILLLNLEIGVWGFGAFTAFVSVACAYVVRTARAASDHPQLKHAAKCLGLGMFSSLIGLMGEDAQFTQPFTVIWWVYMALACSLPSVFSAEAGRGIQEKAVAPKRTPDCVAESVHEAPGAWLGKRAE